MVTAVGAVAAIRSVPALALICHLICLRKIHVHNVWREMRKLPCNQVAHRNQRLIYYVKNCETTIASVALVIGDANVLPVSQFINYNIVSANAHRFERIIPFWCKHQTNIESNWNKSCAAKPTTWYMQQMLFVYLLICQIVHALASTRSSVIRGQCYILSYYYLLHYSDEIMHQIVLHLLSIQRWCDEKPVCRASNTHSITYSPPSRHSHRIEQ